MSDTLFEQAVFLRYKLKRVVSFHKNSRLSVYFWHCSLWTTGLSVIVRVMKLWNLVLLLCLPF